MPPQAKAPGLFHGHAWTLGPFLAGTLAPLHPPPAAHFRLDIPDDRCGSVRLTGRLRHRPDTDTLVVVVHGLGGNAHSIYARAAALAAERARFACLRLSLRGADGGGNDYYHAALTSDLVAVLRATAVQRYRRILLVGYSLGGHLALRFGVECEDPRLLAVGALCPPIDLGAAAAEFDSPRRGIYRRFVLGNLKAMYANIAERQPVVLPVREAMRIRTLAEWDDRIVAPRHGFRNARDYWSRATVAPLLPAMRRRALAVVTEHDPMVPASTVRPALHGLSSVKTVWLDRGGHVGFVPRTDLRLGSGGTVEDQILSYLSR